MISLAKSSPRVNDPHWLAAFVSNHFSNQVQNATQRFLPNEASRLRGSGSWDYSICAEGGTEASTQEYPDEKSFAPPFRVFAVPSWFFLPSILGCAYPKTIRAQPSGHKNGNREAARREKPIPRQPQARESGIKSQSLGLLAPGEGTICGAGLAQDFADLAPRSPDVKNGFSRNDNPSSATP